MSDALSSSMAKFGAMRESRFGSFIPVMVALAAIWLWFGLTEPNFFSARNFHFLFMQSAVVGTLAVGITIVLLIGDIDLSAAATAGVCAAVLAVLLTNGVPAPMAILAAMNIEPRSGPLDVDVKVYPPDKRRRDVDNVQKALLDAMEHGGAYGDDSQIVRLAIEKGTPVSGGKTLVRIQEA